MRAGESARVSNTTSNFVFFFIYSTLKKRQKAFSFLKRRLEGLLCDRHVSARLKGKLHRTVVRPAMMYGLENVALTKRQEAELEVAEMRMLRFELGVTRKDRI